MNLRTCKSCNIEKDLIINFTRRLDSCKNIIYRQECKVCLAKKQKENRHSKSCSIEGCNKLFSSKNLCSYHLYHLDNKQKEYKRKYYSSKKGRKNSNFWTKMRRKKEQLKISIKFKEELKEIYKNCPDNMVIDHIIPMTNEIVTGLHVPWNLQYLTKSENSSKRNKFDLTTNNISWRKDIENKKSAKN